MRILIPFRSLAAAVALGALAGCSGAPPADQGSPGASSAPPSATAPAPAGTQTAQGGKPLVCPVMKGAIKDQAKAPHLLVNNEPVYFCCPSCEPDFKKQPAEYVKEPVRDPVSGEQFKVTKETPKVERNGALFLFASAKTKATFEQNPRSYVKPPAGGTG